MDGFGSRLKKCRLEKGFTQVDLGKRVGMSAQRISNIERSYTTGLGAADIARLAAILETSSDYLVSGSKIAAAEETANAEGVAPQKTEAEGDYIFIAGKGGVRKKIPVPADKLERFKKLVEAGLPELLDDEDL